VGIDVDAYLDKCGAQTLAGLEGEHGSLPFTFRVTARLGPDYDGCSGIRLFRIPEPFEQWAAERVWIGGWKDIDLIRFGHRHLLAPPSINHLTGTAYAVLDETTGDVLDELPSVDELPYLPQAWCLATLKVRHQPQSTANESNSRHWSSGIPCVAVEASLAKSTPELLSNRHGAALAALTRLTRLGEQGHRGVRSAVDTLFALFLDAAMAPGSGQRSSVEARAEWARMTARLDDLIEIGGQTHPDDQRCCGNEAEALEGAILGPLAFATTAATPLSVKDADAVFRRWFGQEYDLDAFHAVAAAIAIERLDGDAPWLLVVSGSGNAKTETVSAAEGAGALVTSTISSEGALISATSAKERDRTATGGLLRRIGDRGVLIIKDVTSVLSMSRDARASVLGALREIADGYWQRNVGTDGGKTLTWRGRIVTIGAVTTAWDSHHSVIAAMGDRFLLLRIDSSKSSGRRSSGRQALMNLGHEELMRRELRDAMGGVVAGMAMEEIDLTEDEEATILDIADIVTLARTSVERDGRGNPVDAHAPEAPTRLAKYLGQIVRGACAIGLSRKEALALAVRIGGDCIPPMRLLALAEVSWESGRRTAELAKAMQKPISSVDRVLQELQLLGLLEVTDMDGDSRWRYRIAADVDGDALAVLLGIDDAFPEKALHAHMNTGRGV